MKTLTYKSLFIIILALMSSSLLATSDNELKIGVLLCLSGDCAEIGQNSLKGIELATEEINLAGGVLGKRLKPIVEDTQEFASPANAVSAYQKLTLQPDINYMIGPSWSVGGLPIAPLAAKNSNIIITSPSLGVAEFNETADNIFNIWPHDSFATKKLAKLAIDQGWKSAVVFSNQNPWEMTQGQTFAKEYQKLGGNLKLLLEPLAQTNNLKTEVLKIKQANPDVVFFSNYTQMDIASIELKRYKYSGKMLAILMDDTRMKNSRGALEGTIFAEYPPPTKDFETKYREKYKTTPGIASDTGYDVLNMYAEAITKANSFAVKDVLPIYKKLSYEGASGKIVFDQQGGVSKEPLLFIVNNSKKELYELKTQKN